MASPLFFQASSCNLIVGGNVGIGTNTPMSKLAINGALSVGTYSGTAAPVNSLIVSGNVGIGSTMPATTLDVNGSIRGIMTFMTEKPTTSGTSIEFTGIPSWAKRITVVLNAVSAGPNNIKVQLSTGGVYKTTGYTSYMSGDLSTSAGFGLTVAADATKMYVIMTIINISGTLWIGSHYGAYQSASFVQTVAGGGVDLGGPIDGLRLIAATGEAFDNGSMNVMYEG